MIDTMEGLIIGGLIILLYLFFAYKWYRYVSYEYRDKPVRLFFIVLIVIPLSPIVIPSFALAWVFDYDGLRSLYVDYEPIEIGDDEFVADYLPSIDWNIAYLIPPSHIKRSLSLSSSWFTIRVWKN